jgi:4-amino-4-deoxychorismate synthase (2-amino-4-deoxychorismate-forming) component I
MHTPALIVRPIEIPATRLLDLHGTWPQRYPALFESAASGSPQGRYDILFAYPQGAIWKDNTGRLQGDTESTHANSFLDALDRKWAAARTAPSASQLPFTGGWLIFLGYEIAAEIEPTLRLPRSPQALSALALRIPAGIVFDHLEQRAQLVAEPGHARFLDEITRDVLICPTSPVPNVLEREEGGGGVSAEGAGIFGGNSILSVDEDDPALFVDSVRRAKAYIAAGDIYQANLSRAWRARVDETVTAAQIYRRLRSANPAPFAASCVWGDLAILSSSPERLFEIRGGEIATRPIAGTRPRSRQPGADAAETSTLIAHPKERAEHVMLIDLERNDLGRICEPGSVRVDEFMVTESYSHVHHIVSNVQGRLLAGMTPGEVLRAVFPGGTITGCPKVRCMQIIAELEGVGRGAYTGSLGFLNRDGSGDFNILIRTMVMQGRELSFRAGAGIVADSEPERELEETRAKAEGLLRALDCRAF